MIDTALLGINLLKISITFQQKLIYSVKYFVNVEESEIEFIFYLSLILNVKST